LLIVLSGLTVLALIGLGGLRLHQLREDPKIPFLTPEKDAQWIKHDAAFNLVAHDGGILCTEFRRRFKTATTIENAHLIVRAMKLCTVFLDGKQIYISSENLHMWKQSHNILIPFMIQPGEHELRIIVRNRNGHPLMLAYSDELGIRTGLDWEASLDGWDWTPVWLASSAKPAAISRKFPSPGRALRAILPVLVFVFAFVFTWTMLNFHRIDRLKWLEQWRPKPYHIRWAMLLLWSVLAANNIFKIPWYIGYDVREHCKYIQYIGENLSLPLATDGLQMFEAPLYYIINLPLCALFVNFVDRTTLVEILRIIPLICGLLQIEIVYRSAKLVFPDKNDLQIITTLVGGLLPMHTLICQVVGNEPLAGYLTSLVILLSLSLLMGKSSKSRFSFFIATGFVWGLALLTKVTAVLLAPPLVIVIAVYGRSIGESARRVILKVGLVFGACFVTSAWYYIRNWIELGKPFVGGWDTSLGIEWWQDPGYRTWSHLISFGEALTYPIYSGAVGLWDAVYSTLWLDGFLSGESSFVHRPPWNDNFMLAGAWLALVPTLFIFTSVAALMRKSMRQSRKAILFALACVAIYFVAIIDFYLRVPIYSMTKASYTLGLLPCYGILIAAGAEPFLHIRFFRAIIMALISCWAVAAYLAYFV